MLSSQEIIGRVYSQSNPEEARTIVSQFRRTLKDPALVQKVFDYVEQHFSDEDLDVRKLIFIGSVYQLYQPLSFLRRKDDDKASGKLPVGVRDEMQRCLQVNNPETINALKVYVEAPMLPNSNGVVRPFKQKVMSIVERFKCYSIHKEDTQFTLAL
ncbi:hypothetical protein [Pedobacter agri]|uniref:hypothetical protein n=1 Tax=Pedobacter agri TaxID=454586 RepID=UPI00278191BA|nr:hypothetical protein [Pedobacter agri]MDQ1139457.1 hypothetical protein [Pedobacter agri]